jgi:hypothetical protein
MGFPRAKVGDQRGADVLPVLGRVEPVPCRGRGEAFRAELQRACRTMKASRKPTNMPTATHGSRLDPCA